MRQNRRLMTGAGSKINVWKRYSVNSVNTYQWNKYNRLSSTSYTQKTYSGVIGEDSITDTVADSFDMFSSYTFSSSSGKYTPVNYSGQTKYFSAIPIGMYFAHSKNYSNYAYPSISKKNSNGYTPMGSTENTTYSCGNKSYGTVTSANINAYPNDSYSGSYWYKNRTVISTEYSQGTYIDDVTSSDASAFPANGRLGDYWYVLQQ